MAGAAVTRSLLPAISMECVRGGHAACRNALTWDFWSRSTATVDTGLAWRRAARPPFPGPRPRRWRRSRAVLPGDLLHRRGTGVAGRPGRGGVGPGLPVRGGAAAPPGPPMAGAAN